MASLVWTAEGGTESATVTTGNSGGASGDAWDAVTIGANATAIYDASTVPVGKRSLQLATGASSVTAFTQWLARIAQRWAAGMTTHYGRTYFRIAAIPGADRTFVELLAADGTTNRGNIRIRSTGTLRIRDAANATVTTTTTVLSINTTYRVEWRLDGSITGAWQLQLFLGNSAVALESLSGTANFGGVIGAANFGYVAAAASLASLWLDAIEINDTGLPGPATYNALYPGRWRGTRAGDANRPIFRLTDDFEDGVLDPQWRVFTGAGTSAVESGGLYTITINSGVTAGNAIYSFPWNAVGDGLAVEMTSAGVQEAGLQAYPVSLQVDENNQVFINVANGFIGCYHVIGGVFTDHGFTAYNSTLHRWFRIRESAGTTYWEASAEGVTWTILASAANPIAYTDITASISANTYLTLGTTKTVSFGRVSAPVYSLT